MISLHELRERIFARAIIYCLSPHNLDMKAAQRRAARELASEYKLRASREKKRTPVIIMPAPVHDDAGLQGELATAKDRLFSRLHDYFARFDARRAAERNANRAAKRAAKQQAVQQVRLNKPAASVPEPVDEPVLPSNVYPLVYAGPGMSSAVRIDEGMFLPRHRDIATSNWRASIGANEAKKRREREQ